MDLGPLRELALELNIEKLGVAALVTRPQEATVSTFGKWLTSSTADQPIGREFTARLPRRLMALKRDKVPEVERGTVIEAPDIAGGSTKYWQVDGVEHTEFDYFIVRLVPKTEKNT